MKPSVAGLPIIFFLIWGLLGCAARTHIIDDLRPTVLLISVDGFRWDYFDRAETPHLDRLARSGVKAERLIPVFPTLTFPTHYSVVTGLHPENHGVVGNSMYDPTFDGEFSMGNHEAVQDGRWWQGEPIWVTAEKQGQTSATFFWPGSEAEIRGIRPTHWQPYDGSIPDRERVDTVLGWLDAPVEERPTIITLYFSEVDSRGHRFGPNAPEVVEAVEDVDAVIGHLIEGLETRGIFRDVNVIITSDHGMAELSRERVVFLDDYVDISELRIVNWGPLVTIWPDEAQVASVYDAIRDAHPRMRVYLREDIPEVLGYRNHRRIAPIVALADDGWLITDRGHYESRPNYATGGTHGYDNRFPSMHGIFLAHGADFNPDARVGSVSAVDLYELMSHILNLDPAPNDGDLDAVLFLLSEDVMTP